MSISKPLPIEDRLAAIRLGDPAHKWNSLDDRVTCVICERTFNGRQIGVVRNASGRVRLRCPDEDCPGTPNEWVHPGNPLVSRRAWLDWERVLNGTRTPKKKTAARGARIASL